ncbi:hypothetical protein CR513_16179, partial [Mucuna pruriens]
MSNPAITFTDRDLRKRKGCDEPMVISIVAAEYRIERVLIDQGSSTNILYWVTTQKMGIRNLAECQGALYGFAGERVPIKGTIELETTFDNKARDKTILVLYTIIDVEASYNIIMGRPALNQLEAIVSTHHLCMKFPVSWTPEDRINWPKTRRERLGFHLDPRHFHAKERPHPAGDLKEVQIRTKDMPSIDPKFVCHRLSINPGTKSMAKKKGNKGRKVKSHQGRGREIQYPTWLANVVMVRNPNGRWRMCTDYTDLNKACPKDPYLLLSIDKLVDGVSGFALLSFIDAYSGYNQIRMHPLDEEKTDFIMEEGRLMDKVFQGVLGVDVEVYVDDMVVKSERAEEHYKVLERRGIEANPDKCQAVIDMRSPQSIKEVQQLIGRITTLSQFISRLAKTAQPIFEALRKGGRFTWTPECEEAFLKLKDMLVAPPVLSRPVTELAPKGETKKEGEWYLSVDGSSNQVGSGVGIVLEGPAGVLIEQSLHFEFKANNNQAEYEELIAMMKLAQ